MNTLRLLDAVLTQRSSRKVAPEASKLSTVPPLRRIPHNATLQDQDQPLLLQVFSALWALLLSFWRSVVGETRAERRTRRKRRKARPLRKDGEVDAGSSSDEGEEWIDPVTRAPEGGAAGADVPFSFRLRSAQEPVTVSDPPPPQNRFEALPPPPSILTNGHDSARKLQLSPSVPTALLTRGKLLPNPLTTSVLVSSVTSSRATTPPPPIQPITRQKTPFHLRKTLILDLDETLIHSTSRPLLQPGAGRKWKGQSHTVEVVLGGRSTVYHVYKRPYVDHFLKKVSLLCEAQITADIAGRIMVHTCDLHRIHA
jgi:CTD nuclear envelope phosphatase 1